MQSLPRVQVTAGNFTFTVEIPSFFTQLAINAERDRLVSQILRANCELNGIEYTPDMLMNASPSTLNYAMLMANFTQTVQPPLPDGFSPGDLNMMDRDEAEAFLVEYWRGLKEQETSFRKSRQGSAREQTAPLGPVGGTPEASG